VVDESAAGMAGAPFQLFVETGKIREFAEATFADNPLFRTGDCSPPTFLTTAFHWQTKDSDVLPAVQLHPQRSLHAEQEFIFHGPPPCAGQHLTGVSRVDRVYRKEGRRGALTFVDLVTEYRDEAGNVVAETRLTGVETGAPEVQI
jgi:hypothetical protein